MPKREPGPPTHNMPIRVTRELHFALKDLAAAREIPLNTLCVLALEGEVRGQSFQAAIANAGLDVSPCGTCGRLVACLPDGLPLCDACGKREAAAQNALLVGAVG